MPPSPWVPPGPEDIVRLHTITKDLEYPKAFENF